MCVISYLVANVHVLATVRQRFLHNDNDDGDNFAASSGNGDDSDRVSRP